MDDILPQDFIVSSVQVERGPCIDAVGVCLEGVVLIGFVNESRRRTRDPAPQVVDAAGQSAVAGVPESPVTCRRKTGAIGGRDNGLQGLLQRVLKFII